MEPQRKEGTERIRRSQCIRVEDGEQGADEVRAQESRKRLLNREWSINLNRMWQRS